MRIVPCRLGQLRVGLSGPDRCPRDPAAIERDAGPDERTGRCAEFDDRQLIGGGNGMAKNRPISGESAAMMAPQVTREVYQGSALVACWMAGSRAASAATAAEIAGTRSGVMALSSRAATRDRAESTALSNPSIVELFAILVSFQDAGGLHAADACVAPRASFTIRYKGATRSPFLRCSVASSRGAPVEMRRC
ncbi:hypothetical protein GGR25_001787 [Kaistia hirudinis]|uniref:Uncharacterized protein n=1 Tax=Kaistia hirudinis TaxID=1293440 RepID=A0A840AN55_9HYPH|nr:hypothetical protein [Kaistia hirudinis]MBB3930748.1 hypothetical protein [Kaistia hirudinis]